MHLHWISLFFSSSKRRFLFSLDCSYCSGANIRYITGQGALLRSRISGSGFLQQPQPKFWILAPAPILHIQFATAPLSSLSSSSLLQLSPPSSDIQHTQPHQPQCRRHNREAAASAQSTKTTLPGYDTPMRCLRRQTRPSCSTFPTRASPAASTLHPASPLAWPGSSL